MAADTTTGKRHSTMATYVALFASTGTLICCALPAALAVLVGGTAVVSLISAFPWLVPLSANKGWIFLGSGLMLIATAVLIYRPKGRLACTIAGGQGCEVAGRLTKGIYWTSVTIYVVGFFFAYALVPLLRWLEW